MLILLRYWHDVILGIAGASALLGSFGLFVSQDELSALATIDTRSPIRIDGKLQLSSKRLRIVSEKGVMLDCPADYCSFPGIVRFNGKVVTALLAEARIVRIVSENQTIDGLALKVDGERRTRNRSMIALLFAVLMAALAWRLRGIPIRK